MAVAARSWLAGWHSGPVTAGARQTAISDETLRRVERASGGLATRAVALMDDRLPWFRALPADQRSWVTLVAQAGIGGYVPWLHDAERDLRLADSVFGTAPRDLLRAVSLRRTVELVRVTIDVAEEHIPALGETPAERSLLHDSLLRYSREIAFAAAAVYATAAETRGALDARVEAAVVDGIVRGADVESLASQASALGWDPTGSVLVVAGGAPPVSRSAVAMVADWARRRRRECAGGCAGHHLGAGTQRPTVRRRLRGPTTPGRNRGAVRYGPDRVRPGGSRNRRRGRLGSAGAVRVAGGVGVAGAAPAGQQ